MNIKIRKLPNTRQKELKWGEKERRELENKILNLRNDQITALFYLVEVPFPKDDIGEVVEEIRKYDRDSAYLNTLLSEADFRENLIWWVDFFKKSNK